MFNFPRIQKHHEKLAFNGRFEDDCRNEVSSEYANSLVKNTVAPAKPSLSSIARSVCNRHIKLTNLDLCQNQSRWWLEKCDTPARHPLNGTANSQEKKQSVEAAAEKPIPPTSSIANLVKDSDSEDEDESKVTSSSSDTSGSQNSESLETSKQDESNEDSEKDHLGDDLSSLPVVALYPYKAQEEDELDITQGDVIKVMDRDDIEKTLLLLPLLSFTLLPLLTAPRVSTLERAWLAVREKQTNRQICALLLITLLTCLITYNAHVVDLWLSHGPAAFSFVARIIAHRDVPFRNLYTFFSLFQRRIFATPLSPHIDFVRALVCL
ncbi:unnamed protein product [Schistocephalus solidus]|uniref:SH3 domain-containing protein n=1 Tax=Schistocephalus solidus TaxID=70667 RepID=A0A183SPP5_SCHSO|nr:unnamed protein product [Schistocephalus solidus]